MVMKKGSPSAHKPATSSRLSDMVSTPRGAAGHARRSPGPSSNPRSVVRQRTNAGGRLTADQIPSEVTGGLSGAVPEGQPNAEVAARRRRPVERPRRGAARAAIPGEASAAAATPAAGSSAPAGIDPLVAGINAEVIPTDWERRALAGAGATPTGPAATAATAAPAAGQEPARPESEAAAPDGQAGDDPAAWPFHGVLGSPAALRDSGLDRFLPRDPFMTLEQALDACACLFGGSGRPDAPADASAGAAGAPAVETRAAPEPPVSAPRPEPAPARVLTGRVSRDGRRRDAADCTPEELIRRAHASAAGQPTMAAPPKKEAAAPESASESLVNVIELQKPRDAPSWASAVPLPEKDATPDADGPVRRVLICWIGKVDVTAAMRHDNVNPGPIRMLMERSDPFDRAILLSTHGQASLDALRPWVGQVMDIGHVEMRRTRVQDLTDHTMVSGAVMAAVEYAIAAFGLPADGTGIWFHLSPGTPATHALLLLLATTRYRGVRLVQTKLPTPGQPVEVMEITVPDLSTGTSRLPATKPAAFGNITPDIAEAERVLEDRARAVREAGEVSGAAGTGPLSCRAGLAAREGRGGPVRQADAVRGARAGRPGRAGAEGEPPLVSHAMGLICDELEAIAALPVPVLFLGESGSGRSRLARHLHEWSGRAGKFAVIDCAGLSDRNFLGELYGQKPDDSPGVWRSREGAFRAAHQGTVFLQNVDALSPSQQAMLLNTLGASTQSQAPADPGAAGEFAVQLPGATPRQSTTARVRVIASAGTDLRGRVTDGTFNSALFYRLAGITVRLPSVREYTLEEREALLDSVLKLQAAKLGRTWAFEDDARRALIEDSWPGNLREFSRALQQICLTAGPGPVTREHALAQIAQGRVCLLPEERRRMAARYRAEELARLPEAGDSHALPTDLRVSEGAGDALAAAAADMDPRAMSGGALMGMSLLGGTMVDAGTADSFGDSSYLEQEGPALPGEDGRDFELGKGESIDAALDALRFQAIRAALDRSGGNRAEAARMLGMTGGQLAYACRKLADRT